MNEKNIFIAGRASDHDRVSAADVRASAHGSLRLQVRYARDRDGFHCADDHVDATSNGAGGDGCVFR